MKRYEMVFSYEEHTVIMESCTLSKTPFRTNLLGNGIINQKYDSNKYYLTVIVENEEVLPFIIDRILDTMIMVIDYSLVDKMDAIKEIGLNF